MMTFVLRRVFGILVPFLAGLVAVVLLTIFFGAWAVSADDNTAGRSFRFGVVGTSTGGFSPEASRAAEPDSAAGEATTSADSWWGSGLLKACPFH